MKSANGFPRKGLGAEFEDYRVLAGFMDDGHLTQVLATTIATLTEDERQDLEQRVDEARNAREDLPPVDFDGAVVGDLGPSVEDYVESVRATDDFQDVYGDRQVEFGLVDAQKLCGFQTKVKLSYENPAPSTDVEDLVEHCIPREFSTATDASFGRAGKGADITLSSDSPNVGVHGVELDEEGAHINIGSKRNWVQVAWLHGRPYLKNGYHRVFNLLERGVTQIPAIVYEADDWQDVGGHKDGFFSRSYVEGLDRPPLVSDFLEEVAIEVPIRRSKKIIRIEVDEFMVPV